MPFDQTLQPNESAYHYMAKCLTEYLILVVILLNKYSWVNLQQLEILWDHKLEHSYATS